MIPTALDGRDVIGLAETGQGLGIALLLKFHDHNFRSGKTGAFALPILHSLMENPQRLYALILAPTRELAFQISEHFEALGSTIGLIVCMRYISLYNILIQQKKQIDLATIVGGIDMAAQTISLSKRPHVIVGRGPYYSAKFSM